MKSLFFLLLIFIDVFTEVGIASAFPQFRQLYGTPLRTGIMIAVNPLAALCVGWLWGVFSGMTDRKTIIRCALSGWIISTGLLGLVLNHFVIAVIIRGFQGVFASGFTALTFISFTQQTVDKKQRSKSFGRLESAASAGAIIGPLAAGSALSSAPRLTFAVLASMGVALELIWELVNRETAVSELSKSAADSTVGRKKFKGRVFVPTAFASIIGLILGALESLIPTLGEKIFSSVFIGKILTTVFEISIVIGVIIKSEKPSIGPLLPVITAIGFLAGYFAAGLPFFPLLLIILLGIVLGAQVVMGNEYAALMVKGFEETGMGLYSTLRISGSFIGPLFMVFEFPKILLALASSAVLTVFLVMYHKIFIEKNNDSQQH